MDNAELMGNSLSQLERFALFMNEGGVFMWIIFGVWCFGVAISLERLLKFQVYSINSTSFFEAIKKYVIKNDVPKALQLCSDSRSLLAFVLKNGLKRANQAKENIEDSMIGSIMEITPKVEDKLSYVSLTANLSTLLGLLGTIQGLIQSFSAVANAAPGEKGKLLAEGIAVAMNTTAIGLVSAITLMVLHTFLTNKGEKIVREVEEKSMKLSDLLSVRKFSEN